MYINEIFDGITWNLASKHTLKIDRNIQYQRYLDAGINLNNIRKIDN